MPQSNEENSTPPGRYHRQQILPQIGEAGQRKLAASRVLLIGCGALGTTLADQLVRAGVGHLTIVDRDIVELTNLQRQTLFDEADTRDQTPKAIAASNRLRAVNSTVGIVPLVADVHPGNIEDLIAASNCDLLLDGTDNVQTRYLINDTAVKHNCPWVYGGAVATEGRVMSIVPGSTPCLRCVFPDPPSPQDLPTCDTAGVLGMATNIVASFQAIEALKLLTGQAPPSPTLMRFDFWAPRMHAVPLTDARDPNCPCCRHRQFDFLNSPTGGAVSLCGRNAVQVRATAGTEMNLERLAAKLTTSGDVQRTQFLVRCRLHDPPGISLTVFPDGRSLIQGLTDLNRAKSLHARYVGS